MCSTKERLRVLGDYSQRQVSVRARSCCRNSNTETFARQSTEVSARHSLKAPEGNTAFPVTLQGWLEDVCSVYHSREPIGRSQTQHRRCVDHRRRGDEGASRPADIRAFHCLTVSEDSGSMV